MIPNGIDLERFTFKPSNSNRLCTYSFFDQPQKRLYDLMLTLRDETLHIGGKGAMSRVMASTIQRFGGWKSSLNAIDTYTMMLS